MSRERLAVAKVNSLYVSSATRSRLSFRIITYVMKICSGLTFGSLPRVPSNSPPRSLGRLLTEEFMFALVTSYAA